MKGPNPTNTPSTSRYIPYAKAFRLLKERLNVTADEIAMWIFLDPSAGGLNAYLQPIEGEPPTKFFFDPLMGEDYMTPLMTCWFYESELLNFIPSDRFISGKSLIKRWSEHEGIEPAAYIKAKIAEHLLTDYHPIKGGTRGGDFNDDSYPSLKKGMFELSQVESIEEEDFSLSQDKSTKIIKRNRDLQTDANDLALQWKKKARKFNLRDIAIKLAQSEKWKEITATTIERNINVKW